MKYLCLVYLEEAAAAALPEGEYDALVSETMAYGDELVKRGRCRALAALEPTLMAATVRLQNGGVSVAGGPFARTREQLAAILVIEARDLNDAIRVASSLPSLHLGAIEVRPVKEFRHQS